MKHNIIAGLIVSAGLIIAGFLLWDGRYTGTRLNENTIAVTDRWTGRISFCTNDWGGWGKPICQDAWSLVTDSSSSGSEANNMAVENLTAENLVVENTTDGGQ